MQRKDIIENKLRNLPDLNIMEVIRYEILSCWWLRFALKILPWDRLSNYFIRRADRKYDRYKANKNLYEIAKKSVIKNKRFQHISKKNS